MLLALSCQTQVLFLDLLAFRVPHRQRSSFATWICSPDACDQFSEIYPQDWFAVLGSLNHADLPQCQQVLDYEVGGDRAVLRGQLQVDLLRGARSVGKVQRLVGVLFAAPPL